MPRFPKPPKQFDFITNPIHVLRVTQNAMLRRKDYRGDYFDDSVGAQSEAMSQAIAEGAPDDFQEQSGSFIIPELEVAWEDAEGVEFDGPTWLTLTMEGQDLLKFKVTDDHHFMFYSNTRNLVDVVGKLEKE
jgi:hypothetical protein